jgi:hypothetical protein
MAAPDWWRRILAVAMVLVAMYHLSRLAAFRRAGAPVQAHPVHVDVELTHAAMGSAMALMVLDALAPAHLRSLGLLFLAPTLWFATRAIRGYAVHGLHGADVAARQVIGCAAMAYMLLILAAPSGGLAGMGQMSMSGSGSSALGTISSPLFRVVVVAAIAGLWAVSWRSTSRPSSCWWRCRQSG